MPRGEELIDVGYLLLRVRQLWSSKVTVCRIAVDKKEVAGG